MGNWTIRSQGGRSEAWKTTLRENEAFRAEGPSNVALPAGEMEESARLTDQAFDIGAQLRSYLGGRVN